MKNCDMILTEKNTKILALLPRKTDNYEYLTVEQILPSNQRQIIKQAKCVYSPLEKASGKNKHKRLKTKD